MSSSVGDDVQALHHRVRISDSHNIDCDALQKQFSYLLKLEMYLSTRAEWHALCDVLGLNLHCPISNNEEPSCD